jgi:AcrR family transcriptional regulator
MNNSRQVSGTRQPDRIDREKRRRKTKIPTIDRRAARTRAALHSALMSLIVRKSYDAISVSDIADEANVGRATFYCHFRGKDDLLRNGAGGLRAMLVEQRQRAAADESSSAAKLLGFSLFMFEHTRERLTLYRALVRSRAGAIVLDMIRNLLAESVREDLAALRRSPSSQSIAREVAIQYVVGGFMSVLTGWLDRGAKEPPEQMDAAFRSLALHGLAGFLSEDDVRRTPADRTKAFGALPTTRKTS